MQKRKITTKWNEKGKKRKVIEVQQKRRQKMKWKMLSQVGDKRLT
jgi:hypothetical protein